MSYTNAPLLKATKTIAILCASALLLFACDSKTDDHKKDDHAHEQHEIKADDHADHKKDQAHESHKDEHAHEHPPSDTPITLENIPGGLNVVQYEMQLLTKAMQDILLHIANNDLAQVSVEISKVHPIYELTHSALEQGLYKPPANSDNVPGFASRDDAFHNDLVLLVRAARANDLPAASTAYGKLVEGCTGCHTEFRFAQP